MLGIGAAALAVSGACPDGVDEPDRRWSVAVDVQPASAVNSSIAIEIRTAFDEPELYVDGQPVHMGHDELKLMQLLLSEPGSWRSYDAVQKLIWPSERSSLENRRRNLFWRVNQRLEHEVDAALARRAQMRAPHAPKIIQCRTGRVRFDPHACRGVSQKI